jgi:MFS family permease
MIRSVRSQWLQRRVGVLGERNFRRFFTGFVTSLLGSSMSTVAIAWAVLDSGVSATGLGLVFTATVVSQVVLLPLAGALADRLGRRRVMLGADVLRCGAQATLAIALAVGRPALWLFILLAWLGGTGTAFFTPALDALTVEIAPRDQLANANALYGLAGAATRIAGPALGGILVAFAGPAVVVAADAATYAVSVLALSLLRLPGAESGKPGKRPAARRTLRADMAEGWADFRSRTWLLATTVQFAFFNLITWAPWMLLGPVMGRTYLGGAAVWGAIMAVQGAGAITAGLLCLGRRPPRPMVVATIGTFCYALPDIPMALHAAAPWVAMAAFGCGAGSAIFATFESSTMQQQILPERLARVSSLSLFPAYGIGVIGYAIDGPLAAAVGPALVFGAGAVYGLLSSAVVLAIPSVRAVRWLDQDPVAPAPERQQPGRQEPEPRGPERQEPERQEPERQQPEPQTAARDRVTAACGPRPAGPRRQPAAPPR